MTFPELLKTWRDRVCTFRQRPDDPASPLLAGLIVEAVQSAPVGPRAVPNAAVTVRGRSGKQVVVDCVRQELRLCDDWQEAEQRILLSRSELRK